MKNFHKALIILAILLVGQLMFFGFATTPSFIVRSTAGNNTVIVPLKSGCKKVSNNCSYPILIPLYPSGSTKSFFLNPPSCVTLSECTQLAQCQGTLPPSAIWNTSDYYEQTWAGYGWSAPKTANHNPIPSANDCRFTCSVNYSWNGASCIPDTKVSNCTGKPTVGSIWNTATSITQTWNGSDWFPSTVGIYDPNPSTTECKFTCAAGYRRDVGTSSCINTCPVPAGLGGGTVTHGTNITAYQNSSVTCGSTCVSQVRICNGETGLLSGSYTNSTCSVQNCSPTANNVSNAGNEASSISLTANATDSDGSIISYQWYSNSTCTITIAGATASTYTAPVQNEPTTRTYYYKAFDNQSAGSNCASATATWNNIAPTASNVSASTDEGSTITLTSSPSDPGGTTFSYHRYSNSTCTTAIATSATYTAPVQNEPTTRTYYYKVFDNKSASSNCASATVTWNNVAPEAKTNLSYSGDEGSTILLTSYVSDPGGTTFSYQWYSNSTCTTAIAGATSATYTAPVQNEPTTITYYYKTFDAQSASSNCAKVTATWNNVAPEAKTNLSYSGDEGSTILLTSYVSDPGGTTFSYQWYSNSTCTTAIAGATSQTYTAPVQNEPTTITYYYKVFDNKSASSICAKVTATWNNVAPLVPTITKPTSSVWTKDRQFCATVSDVGGGNVAAYFVIGGIAYGGNTVASNGSSCYTHTSDLNGATVYAYAKDANGVNGSNTTNIIANIDYTAPTYSGYSNISGQSYINGSDYWFKAGSELRIDVTHTDNQRVYRQYFGFNNNGCSPNGCGGAPNEIKSYNTDNTHTDRGGFIQDDHIDIYSSDCVDGDGSCIDNDLTRKRKSSIKTTIPENDYRLNVFLYDAAMNGVGYSTLPVWIKIDKTLPTTTINSPTAGSIQNANFNVSISDTDTRSGISTCRYRILNNGTQSLGWTNRICNSTIAISIASYCTTQGTNTCTVEVSSTDNVGNISATQTRSFSIDTVAPTITIANPTTTASTSKTITATTNEGTLTMSQGTSTTCNATRSFVAYSSLTYSTEADNGRYVCYKAIDAVGNISYKLSNAIAGIDRTAPTLSSKTTYTTSWYNTNQTSTFTYTDSNGIASGTPVTCTISTEGTTSTCSVTPNVCDAAGNCNTTAQTSNSIKLDKTAPSTPTLSCTVFTNNVRLSSASGPTCSITDTATLSPRTAVAYSTNGGSTWLDNSNNLSFSFTPSQGTTNVVMRISDSGGGPTNSNTYIIKKDTLAPTGGTFTINNDAATTNTTSVTLNTTCATDAGVGGVQVAFGNTANPTNRTTCSASIPHTLIALDGTKTVYMRFKDNLGNTTADVTDTINYIVAVCGNGIVESGETCDSNSSSCTLGGVAGTRNCNASCTAYGSCQVDPCDRSLCDTAAESPYSSSDARCKGLWTPKNILVHQCSTSSIHDVQRDCTYGGNFGIERCESYFMDCGGDIGGDTGGGDIGGDTGGGGCFKAGTQVSLPNGTTENIENLQTGDIVLGLNNEQNTILQLFKIKNNNWELYKINNSDYFVTDTHPFMTLEGWKSLNPVGSTKENPGMIFGQLEIGDILITEQGVSIIYSFKKTAYAGYVYNFRLDGNQTYYADGYLVHNVEEK